MKSSASMKPGGAPTTSRTAHLARRNTSGNANTRERLPQGPRTRDHAKVKTARTGAAAQAAESDSVKYTVIITNVENDFGKLHRACLPNYCGLRSDYEETLDVERLVSEGGPQSRRLISAVRGCSYAVRCRTETRSAEISLYGPANADFAPMQLTQTPRRPKAPPAGSASASSAKSAQRDALASFDELSEATVVADVGAVEQLALRLRRQHYFEEKLPVSVHLPGRTADEVLVRINQGPASSDAAGTETTAVKSEKEGARERDADTQDSRATSAAAHVPGAKRQRIGEESKDSTLPPQRVKTESPNENGESSEEDGVATHGSVKAAEDDVDRCAGDGGRRSQRLRKSKSATIITQFPRRQKDFVTAVAALSSRVPLQRVRGRLRDLPGYLSCWPLYERHLRVVFRDAESLFKAKQLLDQFELEAGLRVSLTFSDPLSRANAEFVHAQESEDLNN
ncbi:hypothetical protein CUR178_07808 [Leishmania enriettii]|uniref:Uncharacterized protein n=1 Tax=Leishmania enriettii TaxID=5663 RepID=A0A836KS10_LEIEN|nr:hypothetical protein CUR178_07808 [Leishmania enriettii]